MRCTVSSSDVGSWLVTGTLSVPVANFNYLLVVQEIRFTMSVSMFLCVRVFSSAFLSFDVLEKSILIGVESKAYVFPSRPFAHCQFCLFLFRRWTNTISGGGQPDHHSHRRRRWRLRWLATDLFPLIQQNPPSPYGPEAITISATHLLQPQSTKPSQSVIKGWKP